MFWNIFLLGNFLLTVIDVTGNLNVRGKKFIRFGKKSESSVAHENVVDPNLKRKIKIVRLAKNSSRTTRELPKETFRLRLSFLNVISSGEKWRLNKNTIKDASKIVTDVFKHFNMHIAVHGVQEIRQDLLFLQTVKPTKVLKRYLKYKQVFIGHKHRIDNTQLVIVRTTGSGQEPVGATTYKTICSSKNSAGIIIERRRDASHLALIVAHNLACSMGLISRKQFCRGDLQGETISCQGGKHPLTIKEIRRCVFDKFYVDLKNYNLNKLCDENRARETIPKMKQLNDDHGGEQNSSKLVLILVTVAGGSGVVLLILAVYTWKRNRDKAKFLNNRVMMEYNYDAMTRKYTRPSVINDSSINVDLEYKAK